MTNKQLIEMHGQIIEAFWRQINKKTTHFVRRKRDAKTAHFVTHCSFPQAATTFAVPANPSRARF